jgi:hypothetical protein
MVEDKYIGLALAVSSSLAIGTSFIITKKVRPHFTRVVTLHLDPLQGLNDAARQNSNYAQASADRAYLRNPIWWAGMSTSQSPHRSSAFRVLNRVPLLFSGSGRK